MNSRITIQMDFEKGTPYIKVLSPHKDEPDPDVRDQMIKRFVQSAGIGYLKIVFPDYEGRKDNSLFEIRILDQKEQDNLSRQLAR